MLNRPNFDQFFEEAVQHMSKKPSSQQDIADACQLWKRKVEDRFSYNKERAVRDLKGELTPSIIIFKDKGSLSKKLRKRGSHWERLFTHSFDPTGMEKLTCY